MGFIDLLRRLLRRSDEHDDHQTSSRRENLFVDTSPAYSYKPPPQSTPPPPQPQPQYYSSFSSTNKPTLSPSSSSTSPAYSYKPPPQSTLPPPQPQPQCYSSFSSTNKPTLLPSWSSTSSSKPTVSFSYNSSSPSPKKPLQAQAQVSFSYNSSSSSPKKPSQAQAQVSSLDNLSSSSPKTPRKRIQAQAEVATSSTTPTYYSTRILKPILSPAPSSSSTDITQHQQGKKAYVCVEKDDSLPVFTIPEDIKALIEDIIVPRVLNHPLSPSTYKDYFAALLYSEDFYSEKWSDYILKDVTLELDEATIYKEQKNEDKTFVAFEIDSVPERRPYLLSRDLVFARTVGRSTSQPFQGFICRVVRSRRILVDFKDDFYPRYGSNQKYDISFSFNRVCLKRAHQAIKAASDALFQNFLFPDSAASMTSSTTPELLSTTCHKLDPNQRSAVGHILRIQGSPPYLVAGPDCVPEGKASAYLRDPSKTGVVVSEAVYQLWKKSPEYRILICAPTNSCCDVLMRSLESVIPKSTMFRANAAFREKDDVPEDILPSCLYEESCFSCPPVEKLRKFGVIFSTYISSFRLHDKGIAAGHFSHIFLVDASSAIEPEILVTLTNLADEGTSVIVTGKHRNSPRWVRADIARKMGLKISYFERLCARKPYTSLSPMFITQLQY